MPYLQLKQAKDIKVWLCSGVPIAKLKLPNKEVLGKRLSLVAAWAIGRERNYIQTRLSALDPGIEKAVRVNF